LIKKAISIGVTAALLGSLMIALVPGTALGASATVSPTPIPTVARATEAGAASMSITESSVCEWSAPPYYIDLWIRDKDGGATVFFGDAGVVGPDSLAPKLYFDPNDDTHITVKIGTANCSQLETLVISGLKIYADGDTAPPGNPWFPNPDSDNAALGDIQVLYLLSTDTWNAGGTTIRSATGTLVNDEESPTTAIEITNTSPAGVDFAATSTAGFVNFGQAAFAGPHPESKDIASVAGGPPVNLLNLVAPGLAYDQAALTVVKQARSVDNCYMDNFDGADNILGTADDVLGVLDYCSLPSVIKVTDSLWALGWSWFGITPGIYDTSEIHSVPFVQRGLTNSQQAAGIWLGERLEDYVAIGTPVTVTLALDPAMGVKWSGPVFKAPGPPCEPDASRFNLICTITGTTDAVTPAAIADSWPIGWQTGSPNEARMGLYTYIDASTASPAATDVMVKITVTGSTYVVVPDSVRIARLNNTADATADAPTVIIGENDQQSGTVTIREGAAGVLGSTASHNVLGACYASHESFTRAPWLVVTAGDLKLRNPSDPAVAAVAAAPGTGVKGQIVPWFGPDVPDNWSCAVWIIWSKSTVASTLEIRGSDATGAMLGAGPAHGPQINVPHWLRPGASQLMLGSSSWGATGSEFSRVVNAIRAFGATPVVAAISNPEIMRGYPSQAAGDVTITETASHQFEASEQVLFSVIPNNLRDILSSVRFDTNRTTPVVSTNAASTGLIAHFQGYLNSVQFALRVDQRAFVPVVGAWVPGVITVSSMRYTTTNDAAYGNVNLEVCTPALALSTGLIMEGFDALFGQVGLGLCFYRGLYGHDSLLDEDGGIIAPTQSPPHPYAWADFDQVVNNAHVVSTGLFPSMSVAAGYKFRETSPYKTFGTLVVAKGTYITNKVYVGAQFQGKAIEFWQRNGKTGTWVKRTTGRVDGKGYAYWSTIPPMLSGTGFARYVYYRAYFAGTSEVAAAWSQTINRVLVK
jgi:hypothetical protein